MKQILKVYKEKGQYVAVLPSGERSRSVAGVKIVNAKSPADRRLAPFRVALKKAQMQGFRKQEIVDYVQTEMLNQHNEIIDSEDYKLLMKKEINRIYQKLKRYRRKVEWFTPNYFVTFTYDDEKNSKTIVNTLRQRPHIRAKIAI